MFRKLKCIAAAAALLVTAAFAGITVSAGAEPELVIADKSHILQEGGLYETSYEHQLPSYEASELDSLETKLVAAWEAYNDHTFIDVSQYKLTKDEFYDAYFGILNDHGEMFYVKSYYLYTDGTYVTKIKPTYDIVEADVITMKAQMNDVIKNILAGVDPSWTDTLKALYIHDYLTDNVAYTYNYYDMYELLVNGRGVCQAYALTNDYLLEQLGINSKIITSWDLNHAWNLVEIDGVWYYTDVTWDDPSPNIEGYSGHENLLRSRAGLTATGHDTTDWTYKEVNIYDTATGTKYDDYFWSGITSPLRLIGSRYFFSSGFSGSYNDGIYYYDFDTETTSGFYKYDTTEKWYVKNSDGSYSGGAWRGIFTGFGVYDGRVFFNMPRTLYSIDVTDFGSADYEPVPVAEYTLPDSCEDFIYGFSCDENGLVTLDLRDDWYDEKTYQTVQLTKKSRIKITSQPVDYKGETGDTATFAVKATGENLTYQWQQNTGSGWVSINTNAGRKSSFSIGVTAARAKYQYRCIVSNGTTSLTSNAVKMVLNDKLAIITQPVNFEGKIGDTAKFTVDATGATSYQWQQNTGAGWVNINTTAGRKSSFSIGVTAARAKYQYRCVISDGTTSINSNAVKMIVDEELAITTQPTDFEGEIGATATFKVAATGATAYQWQQNTGAGWVNINTTAGRKSSFSIGITAARAKYQYRCVISDGTNSVTSNAVKMIVDEELEIIIPPTDFEGEIGGTAVFKIVATGATAYQWQQNTGAGWTAINTSAGRSTVLSVQIAKFRLGYQYRCVVTDGTNVITSKAVKMIVQEELEITAQPTDYVGAVGDTATFRIAASGATTYQWQQNTGAGWTAINTSAGRSTALSVGVAEFRLGYMYRCVVSDGTNSIVSDEVQMVIG